MPKLYGQPFKSELRADKRRVSSELWKEKQAHRKTRQLLMSARVKIIELHAKIRRLEQKARELVIEASDEVEPSTKEKYVEPPTDKKVA